VLAHAFVRDKPDDGLRALDTAASEALDVSDRNLVWLDLENPDDADLELLSRIFRFHPLALEDVSRRHQRPKVDEYPDHYFVVLYAARMEAGSHRLETAEIQMFWGGNYLVTVHTTPSPEIMDLARRIGHGQVTGLANGPSLKPNSGDLVYRLVDAIVDGYFPLIDAIAERAEAIEERMFSENRQGTLEDLFLLKKDMLHLRRVIAPSREVLNVILRRDRGFIDQSLVPYFQDVYDHTVRVIDSLDTYRDLLSTSVDVHLSLTSNSVNQTVKRMTAVTAILMVMALVSGVYGMNFDLIPELHWQYGYAWALGLMAVLGIGLWLWFKRIDWL
jgi:magnesium transporter